MLVGIGAAQTTAEIVGYQRTAQGLPMHPHGHPDPTTLINMGLYDPSSHWPNAQRAYIQGGPKPSTIGRDLQGVSNQIPQWAWLTVGGLFLVMGLVAYKKQAANKKKK